LVNKNINGSTILEASNMPLLYVIDISGYIKTGNYRGTAHDQIGNGARGFGNEEKILLIEAFVAKDMCPII
jgi:hypothetical protein